MPKFETIGTVGEFYAYATLRAARRALRDLFPPGPKPNRRAPDESAHFRAGE